MLSTVGAFAKKRETDSGEHLTYEGIMYEPESLNILLNKFHVEFRDSSHENYHQLRKKSLMAKGKRHKIWNVDGSSAAVTGFANTYKTITQAVMAAEDGDEIHIFPKADGSSYKERLVINKNVILRGMKNTFKAEIEKKGTLKSKLSPKRGAVRKLDGGKHEEEEDEGEVRSSEERSEATS